VTIGPYELLLQAVDQKQEKNYMAERNDRGSDERSQAVMILFPERRNFRRIRNREPWSRFIRRCREDLYVVYGGKIRVAMCPTIHVFLNPLVKWVWYGGSWSSWERLWHSSHRATQYSVLSGSRCRRQPPGFATASVEHGDIKGRA